MKNPFLIGERIYFRPLEREDAAIVQPWVNDPELTRYMRRYRPVDLQSEIELIDSFRKDEHNVTLLMAGKEGDQPIGVAGLYDIDLRNRRAEFGIIIGEKSCWSQGFGREATRLIVDFGFATLNLNRVCLFVYQFNERAIRCYEKVGFQKEGLLRQEYYRDGRYWDTLVMSLLRDDWDRLRT